MEDSTVFSTLPDFRALVVADDPLVRAGLAALLADWPGCTVVGQSSGGDDLARDLPVYRPDAALWDAGWDSPGMDALAELTGAGVATVALLSDETRAAELWAAGARGLLLRDANPARLVIALAAAVQGLAVVDPALAEALLPLADAGPSSALPEPLTPRELEVLQLLAEGLPNKTIARRLDISDHTVKFHVNAIMGKLNARSRTEAAVRAARLGLILL